MVGSMRWTGTVLACLSFFAGLGSGRPGVALVTRRPRAGAGRQGERGGGRRGQDRHPRPTSRRPPRTRSWTSGRSSASRATNRLVRSSRSTPARSRTASGPRRSGSTRRPGPRGPRSFGEAVALLQQASEARPRLGRDRPPAEPSSTSARWAVPTWPSSSADACWPIEPGDTDTLSSLVEYYNRKKDIPRAAEALLKEVLANPKLEPSSRGPARGRVRARQALLGPAQADRQGGRRLRQGDRRAWTTSPPIASRPPTSIGSSATSRRPPT